MDALAEHPHVGDIRGRGLFQSLEFVVDKETKSTFPVDLPLSTMLDNAIFNRGVSVYSGFGKGTADGTRGDHILLSPPLNITSEQVTEIVDAVRGGVDEVFAMAEVKEAMISAEQWSIPVDSVGEA